MKEEQIINELLKLSNISYKRGEIPVAAILIHNNKIIAKSYNQKEKKNDITAHAEILAIKQGARKLKRWNLIDCTLYVTLKPCNMCMEIIKQSHIKNVYYLLDKLENKRDFTKTNVTKLNHIKETETYQQLLTNFFQNMR